MGVIFLQLVSGVDPYDSSNAHKFYREIEERFRDKAMGEYKGVKLSEEAVDFL